MRTTLTLEKDVAVALEQLQAKSSSSFKDVVNEALRQGIKAMSGSEKSRKPFRTRAVDLGKPQFNTPQELKKLVTGMDDENDLRKLRLS